MIPVQNKPDPARCVFSIDVEDWFHILDLPGAPALSEWERLPSRVEQNFLRLLELAAEDGVRCTCFFLGWVAHRFPSLVTAAVRAGHEIASHGWAHRLSYKLTPQEFYDDAIRSRLLLEEIAGTRVFGYRSAGFSLSSGNQWVFDELLRAGYAYDASLFPAARAHGGWPNGSQLPHLVNRPRGTLVEFPMTTEKFLGQRICLFGGGYLRLFPLPIIRYAAKGIARKGQPVIFYVHPREIDRLQPRLPMGLRRRFKTYINLGSTEMKIRALLSEFKFTTFRELVSEMMTAQPGAHARDSMTA